MASCKLCSLHVKILQIHDALETGMEGSRMTGPRALRCFCATDLSGEVKIGVRKREVLESWDSSYSVATWW